MNWFSTLRPIHTIFLGYIFYVFIIFLLLSVPICWRSGVDGVSFIDTLFIATSVISTSALMPIQTTQVYNMLGEIIILFGVQIGGLGYMTIGSYAILASKGHLSANRINIGKAIFAMPASFNPVRFLRHIMIFTVSIEAIGALFLWQAFTEADVPNPLWAAIFHSVTSFCTAGFSIFPNNLEGFVSNVKVNIIVTVLNLLGAIGFIVLDDIYRTISSGKLKTTLTTRIILVSTFSAIVIGTFLVFFDDHVAELPIKERFLVSFFQTVSALTTSGFSTYPVSKISAATVMIIMILMILGASPSGTGGGLKSTTWSAAIATIISFMRGRDEITFFGSKVPHGRVTAAFAAFALYLITFSIGAYFLLLFEDHKFEDIVFEVASALSTVGLSRGITPELGTVGKLIIITIMFIGRFGVVSLALVAVAFYKEKFDNIEQEKNDDIVL
ncbi:MAG: hypothetical protein LBQ66_14630 [Planctomycetaceae bacterium]|nr:hypothetical protein [Planctomycetaceae bacterium]